MLKMPQGPGDTLRNVAVASAVAIYRKHPEDPVADVDERERDRLEQEAMNAEPSQPAQSESGTLRRLVDRLPFG
ncbi:MAG: hypothetical protein KC435_05450 [Thermomicrobiales bacterium]|nr:hypothetical protein [Thermomicrobiales bacterium]